MASQFSGGNPRSTARSAGTVLVVEDDPAVRYSLQFSLEAEGYSVRLFANAGSLLADPDLPGHGCIVADYFLPDGNGLELILMLRGRGVLLPAILLTSNPSVSLRREAMTAKVPIIEKPLLGNALSEEIGVAIAGRF